MSRFAKGDGAAAGMGINNANKIKDKTTEDLSETTTKKEFKLDAGVSAHTNYFLPGVVVLLWELRRAPPISPVL